MAGIARNASAVSGGRFESGAESRGDVDAQSATGGDESGGWGGGAFDVAGVAPKVLGGGGAYFVDVRSVGDALLSVDASAGTAGARVGTTGTVSGVCLHEKTVAEVHSHRKLCELNVILLFRTNFFILFLTQLTLIPNSEVGVVHFKVGEVLQCRIVLNPQHFQSLHLKITPMPDNKEVWSGEELQILEKFFDTRAASPPYKPISMFTFCSMLNVPGNVLKNFVQIMKLELVPGLVQQQGMKWSVQWMLRIPPSAPPVIPTGMSGILVYRSKILFFVSLLN